MPDPQQGERRRVALYSHDTQGLGHVRRNIAIADALVRARPETDVLLLTSAPEAAVLGLPPRTDVVTLPRLHKDTTGSYQPENLHLPLPQVLQLRGQLVAAALRSFDPDLLLVDKVARGVHGELDTALQIAAAGRTQVVLGVRDVLDTPEVAEREWHAQRTTQTLQAYYDQVWVYGDPTVYDPAVAYHWPESVRHRTVYTGYLGKDRMSTSSGADPHATWHLAGDVAGQRPYVLGMVGGGQDGGALASAFAAATYPPGHEGILVTGPYMPAEDQERIHHLARTRTDLTVHRFTSSTAALMRHAGAAVAMGGYNTVCELLATGHPTLIVPRVLPRMEQAVRADALAALGWVDTLRPHELTADRLGHWLRHAVAAPVRTRRPIDLDGLTRIPHLADALLGDRIAEENYAAV